MLIVLHIFTYSMWCIEVLTPIMYLSFFIRATLVDDVIGFFSISWFILLVAPCRITFVFRMSMSSRYSSVVNMCVSSSWNVFLFVPIIWVSILVWVILFTRVYVCYFKFMLNNASLWWLIEDVRKLVCNMLCTVCTTYGSILSTQLDMFEFANFTIVIFLVGSVGAQKKNL